MFKYIGYSIAAIVLIVILIICINPMVLLIFGSIASDISLALPKPAPCMVRVLEVDGSREKIEMFYRKGAATRNTTPFWVEYKEGVERPAHHVNQKIKSACSNHIFFPTLYGGGVTDRTFDYPVKDVVVYGDDTVIVHDEEGHLDNEFRFESGILVERISYFSDGQKSMHSFYFKGAPGEDRTQRSTRWSSNGFVMQTTESFDERGWEYMHRTFHFRSKQLWMEDQRFIENGHVVTLRKVWDRRGSLVEDTRKEELLSDLQKYHWWRDE